MLLTDVETSSPEDSLPSRQLKSGWGIFMTGRAVVDIVLVAPDRDVVGRGADTEMDSQGRSLKV